MGRPRKQPPTEALARLKEIAEIRSLVERRYEQTLLDARDHGASLRDIAEALRQTEDGGVSRETIRRYLQPAAPRAVAAHSR